MKDRRKREISWGRRAACIRPSSCSFWFAVFVLLCCTFFVFSAFHLLIDSFRPILGSTWHQPPSLNAASTSETPLSLRAAAALQIQEAISFPDQLLLFLKYPSTTSSFPTPDLPCLYFPPSSPSPNLRLPAISSAASLVRCPAAPHGFSVSLDHSPSLPRLPRQWDFLAYAAVFDPRDNSTILFAKGLNLRPGRLSDPSRYECLFGWNLSIPKYTLTAEPLSVAQEIIRCKTPFAILRRPLPNPPMVSVKYRGHGGVPLPSVARSDFLLAMANPRKEHTMCVCTMVRNQASFISEWILYHARIGVGRWFIYDNDSDDDIEHVISTLSNYNITHHDWPWVKSQEAGFGHCALRARESCEWVGFIDVDEFLYPTANATLHGILRNYSSDPTIGELRTACHSFGPSGRKASPAEGVMVGYTCRMAAPERHKSIIRPEALNPSLVNVVHHFHLKDGMGYVNVERGMVINHYKYQAWDVFKEKFYRRVATYVADWQDEENVGSKDRAPGLGTKAVEPPDWPTKFCEVNDTGLRDWVLEVFADWHTGRLPWQSRI